MLFVHSEAAQRSVVTLSLSMKSKSFPGYRSGLAYNFSSTFLSQKISPAPTCKSNSAAPGLRFLTLPRSLCCCWPWSCLHLLCSQVLSRNPVAYSPGRDHQMALSSASAQGASVLKCCSYSAYLNPGLGKLSINLFTFVYSISPLFLLCSCFLNCYFAAIVQKDTYQKWSDWSIDLSSQHCSWILLGGAVCCACKQPGVFQLKDLCVNNLCIK